MTHKETLLRHWQTIASHLGLDVSNPTDTGDYYGTWEHNPAGLNYALGHMYGHPLHTKILVSNIKDAWCRIESERIANAIENLHNSDVAIINGVLEGNNCVGISDRYIDEPLRRITDALGVIVETMSDWYVYMMKNADNE